MEPILLTSQGWPEAELEAEVEMEPEMKPEVGVSQGTHSP